MFYTAFILSRPRHAVVSKDAPEHSWPATACFDTDASRPAQHEDGSELSAVGIARLLRLQTRSSTDVLRERNASTSAPTHPTTGFGCVTTAWKTSTGLDTAISACPSRREDDV